MRKETWARQSIEMNSENYSNLDEFFEDVSKFLKILTKLGYQCAFKYDDAGVYVLEYDFDDSSMGTPIIYWLDPDQVDCLYTSNFIEDDEQES